MGHVPHLLLPGPWETSTLSLPRSAEHHLRKVLRVDDGQSVTYTDGRGGLGSGVLRSSVVERGVESTKAEPSRNLTMAVAPPHDRDRSRFLVEKLSELEVRSLLWLRTKFGSHRLPDGSKARAWAQAGLEQSGGAWLMDVADSWVDVREIPSSAWFADVGADPPSSLPDSLTVAIGPEGGWAPEEIPENATRVGLGRTILRVETAGLVAAARFLS